MNRSICTVITGILCFVCTSGLNADTKFRIKDIRGTYTFSFQGDIKDLGPVVAAGIIDIHWEGFAGAELAEVDATGERTISFNGESFTNKFECDLTLDQKGVGKAKCVDDGFVIPLEEEFDFYIEDNGRGFRYVGTSFIYNEESLGVTVLGTGRRQ